MNTNPSPLIPQGSLPPTSRSKSNIRIAVLTIVSIHAVFFCGLLVQGCNREGEQTAKVTEPTNNVLAPLDTTYYANLDALNNPIHPLNNASQTTAAQNQTTTAAAGLQQIEPNVLAVNDAIADSKEYTVVKGDSFTRIAKLHGVTVSAISKANPGVEPTRIKPGQKLVVPAPVAAPAATASTSSTGSGAVRIDSSGPVHVVKAGDNLTKIAKRHGTTIKAIKSANGLRTDRIDVGQKLKLPGTAQATAPTSAVLEPLAPEPLENATTVAPLSTTTTGASAN